MRDPRSGNASPRYLKIRTKEHLALRLSIKIGVLEEVARYADLHYNPTRLREKSDKGSFREIDAPRPLLKSIQRRIHVRLLAPLSLPDVLHAYRAGRSVISATAPHAGQPFWWKGDIRSFYPSVTADKVYWIFLELKCAPEVARLLTRLTTRNYQLPQGAPTSPMLSNLYLRLSGVVDRIVGLAQKHGLQATVFGDDILISGDRPFIGLQWHFAQIIRTAGLRLNPKKSGPVVGPSESHMALGVVMNAQGNSLDVPRSYRRQLRMLSYLYRRHGPSELVRRGFTTGDPKKYLLGKIGFAAQVSSRNARLYGELDQVRGPQ